MTEASYLLRFDDICPTMNWVVWEAIERELARHDVKPILAVVPDNRDPGLVCGPPVPDFWEKVRHWQAMGFGIALHGYQHVYVNKEKGLIGLTAHSEFAGLSRPEQEAKLRKGLAIFSEHGVRADAWVAPSHSFDKTTLEVLAELGLTVISDGLWPWPHEAPGGLFWVPQQLWEFHPKPPGVWTICNHHNSWSERELALFVRELGKYAPRMTDLASVVRSYQGRRLTLPDRLSGTGNLFWFHRIKPFLGYFLRRVIPKRPAS